MNHSPLMSQRLRQTLDNYRRRWRVVHATMGLFLTFCILTGGVGLAVLTDRLLLGASRGLRAGFFFAILGGVIFLLARYVVLPAVRRISDERAAARLGRHFPDVAEDLVTGVELSREQDSFGVSRELVAAALTQIDQRATGINWRAAVSLRTLGKVAAVLAIFVALLVGAYVIEPEAIHNAIARLVSPFSNIDFHSYTRLAVSPSDPVIVICRGDPLKVQLSVSGRMVDNARLQMRTGAETLRVEVPLAKGQGAWQSGALFEDVKYCVQAGDKLTDWFTVRTVPAPALIAKAVRLKLPEYAGGRETAIDNVAGPVSVVQGSSVVVRLRPAPRGNEPLLACQAWLSDGKEKIALAADSNGDLVSAPLIPRESVDYKILLQDGYGLTSRTTETLALKVVPDALPVVTIPQPGGDVVALPNESVPIQVVAQDEFGVRELNLQTRVVVGGDESKATENWIMTRLAEGASDKPRLDCQSQLSIADLGLVPGDRLDYAGLASDYADLAEVRKSRSAIYHVAVLSYPEYQRMIEKNIKELEAQVAVLAARQAAEAKAAEDMAKAAAKPEDISPEAKRAEEREKELAREAAELAKKMADLIPKVARNPQAPPEMMATLDRLSQEMQKNSEENMDKAAEDLKKASESSPGEPGKPGKPGKPGDQGDSAKSAKKKEQEAAENLERIKQELRRMQRRNQLNALADEAERLAKQQEENRDLTGRTALQIVGRKASELPEDVSDAVARAASAQKQISTGVTALNQDIARAARELAEEKAQEAARAADALDRMQNDRTVEKCVDIAAHMDPGSVFKQSAPQLLVAESLKQVAELLRESDDQVMKELLLFIKRQKALNASMEKVIALDPKAETPGIIADNQGLLREDVREQSTALRVLIKELNLYKSETADKLDLAAGEMELAVSSLRTPAMPEALDHGRKALAFLEDAVEKFKEEKKDMDDAKSKDSKMSTEDMLLLARIIGGQKMVNLDTTTLDRIRTKPLRDLPDRLMRIARRQSILRSDSNKLSKMVAPKSPDAAKLVDFAGGKMDTARGRVESADTGADTRLVQREVVLVLEKLLKDQQSKSSSSSSSSSSAAAQAMAQMAGGGGGYFGGTNGELAPTTLDPVTHKALLNQLSTVEEKMGHGFEAEFPAEFRPLMNSYFDQVRKEGRTK